jgi:hypothetical protein
MLCIAGVDPRISSFSESRLMSQVGRVHEFERRSVCFCIQSSGDARAVSSGAARNASVQMDVFPRACIAISAALLALPPDKDQ